MATELTTARRKRTTKRNVVLKTIFPKCDGILKKPRSEEVIGEAMVLIQTLGDMEKDRL